MNGFAPLADHQGFDYKLMAESLGTIVNVMAAHIQPQGGGPLGGGHTHPHNHLFVVTEGQIKMKIGDTETIVEKDCSIQVPGEVIHSIWNNAEGPSSVVILNYMPK